MARQLLPRSQWPTAPEGWSWNSHADPTLVRDVLDAEMRVDRVNRQVVSAWGGRLHAERVTPPLDVVAAILVASGVCLPLDQP